MKSFNEFINEGFTKVKITDKEGKIIKTYITTKVKSYPYIKPDALMIRPPGLSLSKKIIILAILAGAGTLIGSIVNNYLAIKRKERILSDEKDPSKREKLKKELDNMSRKQIKNIDNAREKALRIKSIKTDKSKLKTAEKIADRISSVK